MQLLKNTTNLNGIFRSQSSTCGI